MGKPPSLQRGPNVAGVHLPGSQENTTMKNDIRPLSPFETKLQLKQAYREAAEKVRTAKSPVERDRWAAVMAVTISELQHPDLVNL